MAQFNPTAQGKLDFFQSGGTTADYLRMRSDWLRQMAASEGKEYKPGYVPEGYTKVYSSPRAERTPGRAPGFTETWNYLTQNGKKPTTMYWKPQAYAEYRKDLPAVPWDITKTYQNYWHNPSNVISWMERLRVQDEGYTPPDWVDTEFLEAQYDALERYNGDEDDPLYWKPLPFGSEEAYLTNWQPDNNGVIPIYDAIVKDQIEYKSSFTQLQNAVAQAQIVEDEKIKQAEKEITDWQTSIQTDEDAASVLSKLNYGVEKGYIGQEVAADFTKYAQEQGLLPLEDGSFLTAPEQQPEGGDYLNLYPWQRFYQTVFGQVAMQNQPEYSQNIGSIIGAAMPALGIGGITKMLATSAVALNTTGKVIIGAGALKTAFATGGIAASAAGLLPVIAVGATVLGIGTFLYLLKNKDNPNNTAVQKLFRIMNIGAEIPERAISAPVIAAELAAQKKEVDWSAAYDAGYMGWEMSSHGNFLLNLMSTASQLIEDVGGFFGADWDLSSGETAGKGEAWQLAKGYADPVKAEIPIGSEGLLVSYEHMKALGDNRTRDEMETEWAYLTHLTGTGGALGDFVGQSLVDFSNLIPAAMDKGMDSYATSMAKKAAAAHDSVTSRAWTQMALSARGAIGNLAVDALPMGVQQLTEHVLKGWDSRVAWMEDVKNLKTVADYRVWKAINKGRSISKWARGSQGLPDALNNYMAKMTTGYQMPNSLQYSITPGGRVKDTISLEPGSDGSLMVYNIDGTRSWSYTPKQLDEMDVKLFTNKDGNLTITGVKKLLTDVGVSTEFVYDVVDTTLSWDKPVDPDTGKIVEPIMVDVTDVEYSDSGDPTTYIAKVGNKTYTVDRTTDYVRKIVNENGDNVPVDKLTRMAEHPTFVGDQILTAEQAQVFHDMIVLGGKAYRRFIPSDFKASGELDVEGLRGYLQGLKIPGVDKVIDLVIKASDLTPGTKAMLEAENVKQSLELLHFFSGNNFELTMNALKKTIGSIDIGKTAKAAETFIGSGSMTAAVAAALKTAWGDGTLIDTFIDLYRATMVDRAILAKIGAQIDVKPENLVKMEAGDVFGKLKNKVTAKKDTTSLQLMQMMSDGSLSADTLASLLNKFNGKHASPVTDEGFLSSVIMLTEKNIQDFLIEKYGVKKLDTWSRLSSMKKAMMSPFLIAFPYTTWMNNLYSNLGAQFFLTGGVPLTSKTSMEKLANAIGLENMPAEYGSRMGLASDIIDTVNRINLTMNPMDTIGTITRKLREFGGAIKVYSAIEKYNTASLFVQEVLNQHRRLPLPEIPVNLKNKLLTVGYTEQQIGYVKHFLNRQLGVEGINNIIKGVTYDAIDAGLFEDVGKLIFPNDPTNADLYQQFAEKLFDNEDFIRAVKEIESPDDLPNLREALVSALEKQVDVMMVNDAISTIGEVPNIVSKEGMAGGISVFAHMIAMEAKTRAVNSERWGEAMANATLARQRKDYGLYNYILRLRREDANRMFARSGTRIAALAKGLVDVLKLGDANAKRFLDLVASRSQRGTELMKKIDDNYNRFIDAADNDVFETWDDVVNKNSVLMEEYDKFEMQALTSLGDLFVEMLGNPDAAKGLPAGLTTAELQAGGKKLMKEMIDGFNDLNKKRKTHYAGIAKMSGNERTAANLMFWNTEYQPAIAKIWSNFIDGNWQEFFKTKTDFEKSLYPETALVGETVPKKKAPTSPLSEAENNLINTLSKVELDDNNRLILEAAKARADAVHIRAIWADNLLKIVKATPEQVATMDAIMDSFDAAYTARTGKPAGSWWSDTMKIEVTASGETRLKVNGLTQEAAAVTYFDFADKVYKVSIATDSNFSTALRELSRLVFFSDLLPDIDKAIIAREYGDVSLEVFTDINERIKSGLSHTSEEVAVWRKVNDGFADALRKWWVNDASKAAPTPQLRAVFSNVAYFLLNLIKNLKNRLTKVKLSPAVKEIFEVLHNFKDIEDRVDRNVGRLANAPVGGLRVMDKVLLREITASPEGGRKTQAIGVGAKVPAGIVDAIELINAGGFRTYKSVSGLSSDYPEAKIVPSGYIKFRQDDLSEYRKRRIRETVKELGMLYNTEETDGVRIIKVQPPVEAKSDAQISSIWSDFSRKLVSKLTIPEIEGRTYQAAPKVVRIGDLIGALTFNEETNRVSINKAFDSSRYEIPPSKYTTKQLRDMARALDIENLLVDTKATEPAPTLMGLVREGDTVKEGTDYIRKDRGEVSPPGTKEKKINPILVDPDGMVVSGSDTLLALLYARAREPGIFEKYNSMLHKQAYNWGFQKNALADIQDGILVFQVDKGFDRRYKLVGNVVPEAPFDWRVADLTRMLDDLEDKAEPYLHDISLLDSTLVPPESVLDSLNPLRQASLDIAKRLLKLKDEGSNEGLDSGMKRLNDISTKLEAQIKAVEDIIGKRDSLTPGLTQTSDEISGQSWYYYKSRKLVEGLKQSIFTPDQLRAVFRQAKKSEYKLLEIDRLLDTAERITKDDALAWMESHCLDIEEVEFSETAGWDPTAGTNYRDLYNLPGGEGYRELLITAPNWAKNFYSSHWTPKNVLAHIRFDVRIDPSTGHKVLNLLEIQSDWVQLGKRAGFRGDSSERLVRNSTKIFNELVFDPDPKATGIDVDDGVFVYYKRKGNAYTPVFEIHGDIDETGAATYGLYIPRNSFPISPIEYPTLDMAKEAAKATIIDMYSDIIDYRRPWEPPLKEFGMLALKRMLRYAVDDGFDSLTFSTAKTIAEIENAQIFKDVRTITYNENDWTADITSADGKTITIDLDNDDYSLSKYIGDELAGKVMQQSLDKYGRRTLGFTEPIELSGEKFAEFYDKILVRDMNRYLKQWGIKIEDGEIEIAKQQEIVETRPVHKVVFNDDLKSDVVIRGQPLLQPADEIPLAPLTERPAGSEPVHMDVGGGLSELMEYDIPTLVDKTMDVLSQRMQAGKRQDYMMNIPEGGDAAMQDLLSWAREQQRLRMATVMEGANRVTKDIMIDYARKRGIDQFAEMFFPFQFWYTRSLAMWMKRMVSKPSVMAMAYRYQQLRERNEMTGYPTRLGGKSPVYVPWLANGMGDYMFINPWSKFYTPEQLFQPIQNYASLDAEVATEAQRRITELVKEGLVTPEAAYDAIRNKSGNVWDDAVQHTKLNSMKNEADPLTLASMFINFDPVMNALLQYSKGTPEKISPLPLTRIGNSFEAIGGDYLGIIGAILSYPEDKLREVAGLPQAGEYTDYYIDFGLSNMSTEGKYSVDEIKQAMISRQGQAYDEAYAWAQQYLALRTPGTAFANAIVSGVKNPDDLAGAFLMSFFPSGLFPEGEMELRGLKDEYSQAWDDYERGDEEALDKFNDKYPEYQTRMMMFQEPTQRLRAHLINIIWETYTAMPTANQQIAADELGASFKAHFLDSKTRDYEKIDERTLTNWARRLGYQAPAMPGVNEQAATETIEPMKLYPEEDAAVIQSFIDERKARFPEYYIYQGVYFRLPEDKREDFLKKYPIVEDYWDWKSAYTEQNPAIQSYLDSRADSAGNSDTEYDVEAVHDMLLNFDSQLLEDVLYYQYLGLEIPAGGTRDALYALFQTSGSPGGSFDIWLDVILGE